MEVPMRKCLCILLMCVLMESATSFRLASSSPICGLDFRTFLHDLNSQCPFMEPFHSSPIQVDGESFEKAMNSFGPNNEYTAVLFYAASCPFSIISRSKFSTLSSMYPQIKHIMVEQSSVMPSVFSRYGIHSVPSLLIVNHKARTRYHGRKDLRSIVNFYKTTTGMDPMVDAVEDASNNPESGQNAFQYRNGGSFKEIFLREPYLILSVFFVFLRALLYIYPEIASRLVALWVAYVPRLNLSIFGESRQLLAHVLHPIDLERIWSKLKIRKTINFREGARNARVWASSVASVSLGGTSSSRVYRVARSDS